MLRSVDFKSLVFSGFEQIALKTFEILSRFGVRRNGRFAFIFRWIDANIFNLRITC